MIHKNKKLYIHHLHHHQEEEEEEDQGLKDK